MSAAPELPSPAEDSARSAIRSGPHLGRIKRNAEASPLSKEQADAINAALTILTDDRHAEAFPVMTVQGKESLYTKE